MANKILSVNFSKRDEELYYYAIEMPNASHYIRELIRRDKNKSDSPQTFSPQPISNTFITAPISTNSVNALIDF